jgi:hypothetical protein
MILDEGDFYMKIAALDEICNFLAFSFFSFEVLRCSKKLNKVSAVY